MWFTLSISPIVDQWPFQSVCNLSHPVYAGIAPASFDHDKDKQIQKTDEWWDECMYHIYAYRDVAAE